MTTTVLRYQAKPERAEENQQLIEAVFADADAAARELAHLPSPKSDEILADPDLLVTSDLVELILGQKASDVGAVDAAAYRLLGRSGLRVSPLSLGSSKSGAGLPSATSSPPSSRSPTAGCAIR